MAVGRVLQRVVLAEGWQTRSGAGAAGGGGPGRGAGGAPKNVDFFSRAGSAWDCGLDAVWISRAGSVAVGRALQLITYKWKQHNICYIIAVGVCIHVHLYVYIAIYMHMHIYAYLSF